MLLILLLHLFYNLLNLSFLITLTTILLRFFDILCFYLFGRFLVYNLFFFCLTQIIFFISELLKSLSNFYRVYEATRFIRLRIVLFGLRIIKIFLIDLLGLALIYLWLFLFLSLIISILSLKLIGMLFVLILLFAIGL